MADPKSGPPFPWPDKFAENSAKFPTEELWKYVNQQIAWNWEGTQILAGAPTDEELTRKLEAMGIDLSRVVFDYVDDPNVSSCIGGLM